MKRFHRILIIIIMLACNIQAKNKPPRLTLATMEIWLTTLIYEYSPFIDASEVPIIFINDEGEEFSIVGNFVHDANGYRVELRALNK